MNYLKQINGFWAEAESKQLSSSEIAIYMALLNYNNKLNWISPFICHYHFICQSANVSKNSYYKNMAKLSEKGLIKFIKGERNKSSPRVFIINLENKKGTIMKQDEEQDEELTNEQWVNLCKQYKPKNIKLLNNYSELVNNHLENWIKNAQNSNQAENILSTTEPESFKIKQSGKKSIMEFKDKLLMDTKLIEYNATINGIEQKTVLRLLGEFIENKVATCVPYEEYSNVSSHFTNWLRKNKANNTSTLVKTNGKVLGLKNNTKN